MSVLALLPLLLRAPAAWAAGGAGVAAGEFLNIGANTRAAGMGEAYVGIADDVGALEYNPAGLVRRREMAFTYLHASWLGDLGYDHVAGVYPHPEWGAFGAGFSRLFLGGTKVVVGPSGEPVSGGDFQAGSLAASAGYARQVAAPMSVGGAVKFLSQDLDGARGSAVAVDAGMLYRSPLPELTMGAQLANVGTRVNASGLPVVLKVGAGLTLPPVRGLAALAGRKGQWDIPLLAADMHFQLAPQKPRFITVFLGSEYAIGIDARQGATARLGYRYGEEGAGGLAGAAAGFGYRLSLPRFSLGVDYALVHYGELGLTHRFAVTTGFSPQSEVSVRGVDALVKESKKEGQIYLNWSPAAEPQLTGYNVYMGEAKDADFGKVNRSGPVSGTSLVIRGLTVGRTYYFFVTPISGTEPAVEGRPFFETSMSAQPVP